MKPASLLDVYGDEPCDSHHHHGNEAGYLSNEDGKDDKAYEGCTDGSCRESQEPSSYSHEFKGLLYALENWIAIVVDFHSLLMSGEGVRHQARHLPVCGFYLKNNGRASDMAINATQPPMVIMMVFFTS